MTRSDVLKFRHPDLEEFYVIPFFKIQGVYLGVMENWSAGFRGFCNTPVPEAIMDSGRTHQNGFYIGEDPASPMVGDVRVQFMVANPTEVSIVAKQSGNTFESCHAKAGGIIELLQIGAHTADAMIQKAQKSNKTLTWILRGVGFFIIFLGLVMILKPLCVIADVVPFVGSIVGAGTGIIAFLLASILSLITIAIAWVVYRPVIGIILIVVAVGLVGVMGKLGNRRTASARDQKA